MSDEIDLDALFPKGGTPPPSVATGNNRQNDDIDLDSLFPKEKTAASPAGSSAAASPETAVPVSTGTDIAKSGASGLRSGVEGLLGLPGQIDKGGQWLVSKALEKLGISGGSDALAAARAKGAGFDLPTPDTIHAAADKAGVPDYTPQTTAGKYAKTVGEFVPGALTMPEATLPGVAANVVKYGVVPGLASEAGGQAFAGTKAEPFVRMAAGLAGGLGAEGIEQAGRAALGAGQRFVEPLTQAGRENWAARTFQNTFADKDAAKQALDIAKAKQGPDFIGPQTPTVPGSLPTTGQLTGDLGALAAEREMSTRDPAFFKSNPHGTGSEQQNAARTAALQGIQPTGAPESVAQAVRTRLTQIEAQHDAAQAAALQAAKNAASGIGGTATPETIGANLRDALQNGRDAAKVNERKLWAAVDPDGTLAMPAAPIAQAAAGLVKSMPATAKPLAGEEAAIFGTAAKLPPVALFNDITALRSRISTAMREEMRSAGQTPTYARLAQLRESVEGAISGAVENKAAAEAKAVASGAMAPEETMAANLRAEADAFQRARAQNAAGANASQDNSGLAGVGSARVSGPNGAKVQGYGGFGNSAGDQGVPLTPNLDDAAAQRLKAASAATRDRAQTFDQGPVGSILKTQGQAGDYRLADAAVPAKLFQPGPAGAQTIDAYRKAAGPNAETFLHDAAAQNLNREAVKDGILDPGKYQAWAAKHQDALRALPAPLKAKFSNAAAASAALEQAAATRKAALDLFQQSAAAKFLNLKNPQDVTRTVGGIFEAKDGVHRMTQLADALKSNADAREGLRKAVADYVLSKAKGTTEAGASGVANLNAGRFQTLIRNNAQTLKAAGFSDEEIGLMRAIGEDMRRSQRTLQATKLPGQSNTMQDLVSHIQSAPGPRNVSLLAEMLAGGLGGLVFGPHGSAIGALSGFAEHVVRGMRRAGIADASTMVRDAMFNPELARALLEKTPKSTGVFSHTSIGKALAKMSAFTGETSERKHRAHGGAVAKKRSHEELVSRLMDASEKAKNATKRDTRAILSVPDNAVAKALEVAQKAI